MGTAIQAIKDPQQLDSFNNMMNDQKKNRKRTAKLSKAIREVIKKALENDENLRDAFSLAAQDEIKKQITDKYNKWKDEGSKPSKFPF
jgi:hypothetical protein